MAEIISRTKNQIDKNIVLGFGIKNKNDIERALLHADGLVIGTEAVKHQHDTDAYEVFLKSLSKRAYP